MNSEENKRSESKIEMRSQYMSGTHTFLFSMALMVAVCLILVLSTASTPMLLYDESEIYSCPEDYISTKLAEQALEEDAKNQPFNENSGKGLEKDPVTGMLG